MKKKKENNTQMIKNKKINKAINLAKKSLNQIKIMTKMCYGQKCVMDFTIKKYPQCLIYTIKK